MKGKRYIVTRWIGVLVLSIFSMQFSVYAKDSVKDLQKQKNQLQNDIAQTEKMLKETKKNETATLNKLHLLGENIKAQRQLIATLGSEIQALDLQMQHLTATRDSLQVVLEEYKNDYAETIRKTHYARMQQSTLLFVLSSESFQQAVRRTRYLQQFAEFRKTQVEHIKNTQAEIDTQNELLQANRDDKQSALDAQKKAQEDLQRNERKEQTMLKQLKNKEKDLDKKRKQQEAKVAKLNKKIDDMIAEQARKSTPSTMTPEQKRVAGGFEANKGRLPWPVEKGMISGHFGKQQHAVHSHVTTDNKGIYIQTVSGTKARSVYEGVVTGCFMVNGTYAVIIQHGNYRTVYSNLSSLSVKENDNVKAKQNIGTIFTDTDEDNKTELYFQIYKDKNIINPEVWIAK